jgi:hypothetical protein
LNSKLLVKPQENILPEVLRNKEYEYFEIKKSKAKVTIKDSQ